MVYIHPKTIRNETFNTLPFTVVNFIYNKHVIIILYRIRGQNRNEQTNLEEIVDNNDGIVRIFFAGGIKNLVKILNQEIYLDLAEIKELNLRQSTLEDVFLILAGRRLSQ